MLHEFLTANAPTIVARARAKVAARTVPMPTEAELEHGVPLFLRQLIDRLQQGTDDPSAIEGSAALHGGEMLALGFTVSQVVRGYGDVCQVITQLADEINAPITVEEFRTFNRCLDEAIAHAVTEYERLRDVAAAAEGSERLGTLAHELRNRLGAATLAYGMLREGTVAIGGSTGAVLGRSLRAMQALINSSLAGVRLDAGLGQRQRISIAALLGEVEVEAAMGADVSGLKLAITAVGPGVDVEGDGEILSAAVSNLLQNAFKFSRPPGTVSLRATATPERVRIEVEDACGGLPPGRAEGLFRPFAQRGADRSGLGLGLTISRKGVEAMGGTLGVRDLPGRGCVFTIELPRLTTA
jgi:signal transduction histidine kinase